MTMTPVEAADRKKKQTEATGAARARVLAAHKDEYQIFLAEEHAKRGLTRRADPDQKIRNQIEKLARDHPDLVRAVFAEVDPNVRPELLP